MYLAHNSRIQKDKEGLVLAHAYNPSTEAELKSKAPGLHSKMTLHKKKKTNNSASSGASSAPMTEPPTPWLRQHVRGTKSNRSIQGSNVRKLKRMAQWASACPTSVKTRVQSLTSHETATQAWKPAYNYSLKSQRSGSPRVRLLVRPASSES